MSQKSSHRLAAALTAALLACGATARAQDDDALGFERTPPRLSFTDGEVSFWRDGAEEWTQARVNTALAAGDELYTDEAANLELQIGARAFVRAGENTQLGLTSLEPDFLQLRVTTGHVSLDLRSLTTGQAFELDTPNAAFTVERSGYYRVEVDGDTTTFTTRRGGRAVLTPPTGASVSIASSEQVVVSGVEEPQIESYAAPELDSWDRWNYARTDRQIDSVSARYVPSGVYGTGDLDYYGDWRVVPRYGAIWVPRQLAVGWVPYSTGRWLYDPYYSWTWVDDAPWGWAPYHYGRWVHVSGFWGWCPGPIVVRPYYAPALVAFYGGGGFSVGVTFGSPYVGWVGLGWGEPIVPWWGPTHFRSRAHWAGWGGPRVVNNVVVKHKTVIKAKEINIYRNAHEVDAIVAVDRDHFGRRGRKDRDGKDVRFTRVKADKLSPLHGEVAVRPDRSSLVAGDRIGKRPPKEARERSVVAARAPRFDPKPELEKARSRRDVKPDEAPPAGLPPARVVEPRREGKRIEASKRPPFAKRGENMREIPPPAPRFERSEARKVEKPPKEREPTLERVAPPPPERGKPAPVERSERVPQASDAGERAKPERVERVKPEPVERVKPERGDAPGRYEPRAQPPRELPGEPANRVYRGRPEPQGAVERRSEPVARAPKAERTREPRAPKQEKAREPRGDEEGKREGRGR
jgi:hypothetical protein